MKPEEKAAIDRYSDSIDLTASSLCRKYILDGLARDGVKIEA